MYKPLFWFKKIKVKTGRTENGSPRERFSIYKPWGVSPPQRNVCVCETCEGKTQNIEQNEQACNGSRHFLNLEVQLCIIVLKGDIYKLYKSVQNVQVLL